MYNFIAGALVVALLVFLGYVGCEMYHMRNWTCTRSHQEWTTQFMHQANGTVIPYMYQITVCDHYILPDGGTP